MVILMQVVYEYTAKENSGSSEYTKEISCMLQNLRTLKCKLIYVLCQNTVKPITVHYYIVVFLMPSLNQAHKDTGFLVGIDDWPRLSGIVRGIQIQS